LSQKLFFNSLFFLNHERVYTPVSFIFAIILPIALTWYLGEDIVRATNFNMLRYTLGLHIVWLVNSGAHKWGMRPYDEKMSASETYIVAFLALGEGWHNYHHCFP
jgi:stearoyl-CoA desaturase (Delta-9 desaturase)